MNKTLKKLPQELINQIAAGEVVERPASVVKELLDNAVDAGADQIKIKLTGGGIDLIEISDNGVGIEQDSLEKIFQPHTTSKISTLEDLNNISTMGFRGEALSTIKSVAKVSISSKYEQTDLAYSIDFDKSEESKKSARNQGTTITIKDLFYNIPARRKFLKTVQTEYRKILEVAVSFFLQFPNIHFILENEGKEVYNLPKVQSERGVTLQRIKETIRSNITENLIEVNSEGAGVKISGFIGHPSLHQSKTSHQYIFINSRPVWDSGVAKSIQLGYKTLIPKGEKVPFIVDIKINNDLVDVNVHPRKEEVKFLNPYRVYSALETAVQQALKESTQISVPQFEQHGYTREERPKAQALFDSGSFEYKSREINFNKKGSDFSVKRSLEFSKEVLSSQNDESSNNGYIKNTFQLFNKYIAIEFEKELHILDQHAAAERITFEKLLKSYNSKPNDIQNLLVPIEIEATPAEVSFVEENTEFFSKLGFDIEIKDKQILIKSTPAYFQQDHIETIFKEIWQLSDEQRDMKDSFEKAKESILATMSCHSSIRTGQSLTSQEGRQLYEDLKKCDNPYSCPHGRPITWKMKLEEIDTNFERTY